jgi:glycosyltransferase involved in cell wall biosynthesis
VYWSIFSLTTPYDAPRMRFERVPDDKRCYTSRPVANLGPQARTKISVVVPTYNRGYIISESIKSVLGQTYQDFELVIVDDGSKDNTHEVVSRFADPRIRYTRHEHNRGCSAAYNTGLREARGEFVAILDSDDIWKPERLAKAVNFLKRHPEADAVFTDMEKYDGSQFFPSHVRRWCPLTVSILAERQWPKEVVFTQKEMYLCFLQEFPLTLQSTMMRSEALKRVGYLNESWISASDWDLMLRFSKQNRLGYIDEPLTVLRVQSDAVHHVRAVEGHFRAVAMLRDELEHSEDSEIRKSASVGYNYQLRQLSWAYLERGQRWKAFQALVGGFLRTRRLELLARAGYSLVQPTGRVQARHGQR